MTVGCSGGRVDGSEFGLREWANLLDWVGVKLGWWIALYTNKVGGLVAAWRYVLIMAVDG